MPQSSTPALDAWQDLHAKACKAEHNLLMSALSYLSVGGQPPSRDLAKAAKDLRARACATFEAATNELFSLVERTTLSAHLARDSDRRTEPPASHRSNH